MCACVFVRCPISPRQVRIPPRASTLITHHAHYGSNDVNAAHLLRGSQNFDASRHIFFFFFCEQLGTLKRSLLFCPLFTPTDGSPRDLTLFFARRFCVLVYNLKSSLIIFVKYCTYFLILPPYNLCLVFSQSLAIRFCTPLSKLMYLDLLLTISGTDRGRGIKIHVNSINLIRKLASNTSDHRPLGSSTGNPNNQFFNRPSGFESWVKQIPRTSNGYYEGSRASPILYCRKQSLTMN